MAAPKGNKYAKGNPPGIGRPSGYSAAKHDVLVMELGKKGLGRALIAKELGISMPTLDDWRKKHKSFSDAYDVGRKLADEVVVGALFKRAVGCSHPDTHVSTFEGEVTLTPLEKHYPPDVNAAKFWLMNRDPKTWKERIEQTGSSIMTVEAGDSIKDLVARIRSAKNVTPIEAAPAQIEGTG